MTFEHTLTPTAMSKSCGRSYQGYAGEKSLLSGNGYICVSLAYPVALCHQYCELVGRHRQSLSPAGEMSGFRKAAECISETLVALSESQSISAASQMFEAPGASDDEIEDIEVESKRECCLEYSDKAVSFEWHFSTFSQD